MGQVGRSVRAAVVNPNARVGNRGGQGTARPTRRRFFASGSLCYYPGISSKSRHIRVDEGCLDPY